jgi:FkbM family methyltransferase
MSRAGLRPGWSNELLRLRRKAGLIAGDAIRTLGWEVRRVSRNPEHSLLGLRSLDVRTIIDVGANTGQFAKTFLAIFPRARIISFEPIRAAFGELSSWASTEPRATAINVAVGDTEGTIPMIEHTEHTVSSSILPTTDVSVDIWPAQARQRVVDVRMTTLDEALGQRQCEPEVLVKLDVQGYEDRVIRGGKQTLRRAAAAIVEVNLDSLYKGQAAFADIVSELNAVGLEYSGSLEQSLFSDGHVIFFDALFLRRNR